MTLGGRRHFHCILLARRRAVRDRRNQQRGATLHLPTRDYDDDRPILRAFFLPQLGLVRPEIGVADHIGWFRNRP